MSKPLYPWYPLDRRLSGPQGQLVAVASSGNQTLVIKLVA